MEKRLIGAIALSFLVLLAFQFLGPKKKAQMPIERPVCKVTETVPIEAPQKTEPRPERPTVTEKETDATITTDGVHITFSDIGGSIKNP